jgi:hypothetical protein
MLCINYQSSQQPSSFALESFADGGVTLTVSRRYVPATVVALLIRWLMRRQEWPFVVGVSPRSLYLQNPGRWIKPGRFFRHDQVENLSVRRQAVRNRGWRTGEYLFYLELHIRFEWPLQILNASTPDELLRIGNQLRAALKLAPQTEPLK